MKDKYVLLVNHEWQIPATAAFVGRSEEEIRKEWERAHRQGSICIIEVEAPMPPHKRCPDCKCLAHKNAHVCKTPGCEVIWL